jgi:hypothetical protein
VRSATARINPLTPELNPSAQRCLTRFFAAYFASRTVNFTNICVKIQQNYQLFIQFINDVWELLHVSAMPYHRLDAFLVRGDLKSQRTTPLDTTRPSTIFYRLLLN